MTNHQRHLPVVMTFMAKDPEAPLRFEPPDGEPPYQQTSVRVKQLDRPSLDEAGAKGLALFSWFFARWEQNRDRDIADAKAQLDALAPSGPRYEVRTDVLPNRRFSGDGFLSRSRYYSVSERGGNDGGTMLRELITYHDPLSTGIVDFTESTNGGEGPGGEAIGETRSWILVTIPPVTTCASDASIPESGQWRTIELRLPVIISEQSFARLLDLRVPSVAAWFTRNLTRLKWLDDDGRGDPAFPNKPPLDRFTDLLPSLAAQDPGGGNGATRIAGQWLRSLGADGLVFPSARSDASVQVRAGEAVASYGWNLVDYRGAAPARLRTFDLTTDWPTRVPGDVGTAPLPGHGDVSLRVVGEGSSAGSWAWQNLERANRSLRQLSASIFLYRWARSDATNDQLRRLVTMLGAAERSEQLAHRSQLFIAAMRGDPQARRDLVDGGADWGTRDEAWLDELPDTFDLMDARVAEARACSRGL